MAMRLQNSFCFLLFITTIGYLACNDSPTQPEQTPGPPQLIGLSLLTYRSPANAPAEVKSASGEGLADLSFALQMFSLAGGKAPLGQHPDWEWKGELPPYELIVKAKRLNAETVAWELRMDGGENSGSIVLNNWLAADGTTQNDGKSGAFKIYQTATTRIDAEASWTLDDQNVNTIHSETNGKRFDYTGNPDASGNFSVHTTSGQKLFEANWDTSGAGAWAAYDAATGQQTGSGTWSS